jgi:glutamate-1-semialdehyde aminotransferase
MFGGESGLGPMVRSEGCRAWTANGRELIDWTMALGAVSLGYAHPHVTEAAVRAAFDGTVGPLPPALESRVAERLVAAYPGAERARFFKTGAEAVQAAVRLARVATGRESVLHVGYHGWLDGPTSGAGVPRAISDLWIPVAYDSVEALAAAAREKKPAAIMLEPFIERLPGASWLAEARRIADECGAVLIFDEIKTGFRLARGGAAEAWKVAPDLGVLGKALANGYPLAAVAGRAALMDRVRDTWISSTLATEFVSLAAADAVLDVWEKTDVAGHIQRVGDLAMAGVGGLAGWKVQGIAPMWFVPFHDPALERRVLLGCVERGVLIKRGAYNFPSLAHTEGDVARLVEVMREVVAGL